MELVKQLRELLVKANVCMKADWEQAVKIAFESIYKMQNMKIIEGTLTEKVKLILVHYSHTLKLLGIALTL